jgi:chemotaxis response regulator CheB
MLTSLAESAGTMSVAVVMSGPGTDGAEGVVEVRKAGGIAVVQDITNCMDPSMPLAVLRKGSVEQILPDYLLPELFTNPENFRRG